MKILVAMSGGVDSSVVAHLLKQQGHDLVGVMMKLWVDPLAPEVRRAIPTKCCSLEHIARARSVCETLDIPFYVVNLEDEFKEKVVDPFLEDYEQGKTPNPCIQCNKNIKFGTLLKKMKELGCEKLATGHYVRVNKNNNFFSISRAVDASKDQSYYLYALTQDDLQHVMFPLGEMTKDDTFRLAEEFDIPLNQGYRESQDLCFFPEKDPEAFLGRYLKNQKEGDICLEDETKVGTHKGIAYYTIGQRKGLGIGGQKIPLYVTSKEQKNNTIYVAPNGAELATTLKAKNMTWATDAPEKGEVFTMTARIHSLGQLHEGTGTHDGKTLEFSFNKGLRGIAPGQSIVFYDGDTLLGGAEITA